MKRMKTFLIYALIVIAVILLTDVVANLILDTNKRTIKNYEIVTTSPAIEITEAKGTNIDGKIKGIVKNNSEEFVESAYLKVELKSKRGVTLGTEYKKMGNFQPSQSKEFELKYRYSGVDNFVISVEKENEIDRDEAKTSEFIKNASLVYRVARLIAWAITPGFYFIPFFIVTTR